MPSLEPYPQDDPQRHWFAIIMLLMQEAMKQFKSVFLWGMLILLSCACVLAFYALARICWKSLSRHATHITPIVAKNLSRRRAKRHNPKLEPPGVSCPAMTVAIKKERLDEGDEAQDVGLGRQLMPDHRRREDARDVKTESSDVRKANHNKRLGGIEDDFKHNTAKSTVVSLPRASSSASLSSASTTPPEAKIMPIIVADDREFAAKGLTLRRDILTQDLIQTYRRTYGVQILASWVLSLKIPDPGIEDVSLMLMQTPFQGPHMSCGFESPMRHPCPLVAGSLDSPAAGG